MKMHIFSRLLSLAVVAVLLLSLCACGSGTEKGADFFGKGGEYDATSATRDSSQSGESLWSQDIELLRGYGYTSSLTRESLYQFEGVIGAAKNSIEAIVTATNSAEEKVIIIYYLKTESDAQQCIGSLNSAYKQVGRRIVHMDQDNLIHN